MAVPDSLTAWRQFVNRQAIEPESLTAKQVSALSPEAKAEYDEIRFAWLGADIVLETHDTQALQRQFRITMIKNTAKTGTASRGLAISGASGLGKSTTAMLLGRRHEKTLRRKTGRLGNDYAPVVYSVVPSGTTPKMMMLAFANFLGLPVPHRTTAQALAEQVLAIMRDPGTSLVIVDEVHNLKTSLISGSEAASALKGFSERLDATFIYAGIDLLQSDLFAGEMGRQIKGRMTVHETRPYGYGTQAQRDAWTELVLGIESVLPLLKHSAGSLEADTTYLYDRTGGSIGSLRALLNDAGHIGHPRGDRKSEPHPFGLDQNRSGRRGVPYRGHCRQEQETNRPQAGHVMHIDPLPIPTRVYDGEGVTTYSHPHSARNHTTPADVERALRERGVFASGGRSSAERLEIWRQLGNLRPDAFSGPDQIAGNKNQRPHPLYPLH